VGNNRGYYVRLYLAQGVRLLSRNRFWSVITALVVALLLFVVYVMVAAAAHTREAARKVDDQLVVTAIVSQDPKTYKSVVPASQLAEQVRRIPNVRAIHVVSEEETRSRFVKSFKGLKTPPAVWVFQEALEISVTDTSKMEQVRASVMRLRGVDQATYLEALVKKLTAVSGYLERMALFGALLLGAIAVMLVMAVVRTAIHSEQRSVATMSAVGGSLWAIAAPLLVHLLIVTVLASLVACVAGWWIDPQIGSSVGGSIKNLPEWLRTGRAYGLLELWPLFALGASLAVSIIVCWGTWRYARRTHALN
jgi:cell division protein FtsX